MPFLYEKDSLHYMVGDDIGEIQNFLLVKFANEQKGDVIIRLLNSDNEVAKEYLDAQVEPGFHQAFVDVKNLDPGQYQLVFIHLHYRKTTKFVISS